MSHQPDICPDGYSNPQAWCDWRNREMDRRDLVWTVRDGKPQLVAEAQWEIGHDRAMKERAERDRRDWQHRQRYPVTARENDDGHP